MGIDPCLISPASRAHNHFRHPLALMYISGYLEKKGITTHIIDIKASDPVSEVNEKEFYENTFCNSKN